MIAPQQPPERARVPLHAVRAANNEDRRVQYRERPLRFAGEIHMARRIQKRYGAVLPCEPRLLREDRNAALTLLRVGIEKSVRVIHAPQTAQRPGGIKESFRKRRFPRVHMRKDANAQRGSFRIKFFRHTALPFLRFGMVYYITKGRILQ